MESCHCNGFSGTFALKGVVSSCPIRPDSGTAPRLRVLADKHFVFLFLFSSECKVESKNIGSNDQLF